MREARKDEGHEAWLQHEHEDGFSRKSKNVTGTCLVSTRSPIIATQNHGKLLAHVCNIYRCIPPTADMQKIGRHSSSFVFQTPPHGKENLYLESYMNSAMMEAKKRMYMILTGLPPSQDGQKGNQSLHGRSGIW